MNYNNRCLHTRNFSAQSLPWMWIVLCTQSFVRTSYCMTPVCYQDIITLNYAYFPQTYDTVTTYGPTTSSMTQKEVMQFISPATKIRERQDKTTRGHGRRHYSASKSASPMSMLRAIDGSARSMDRAAQSSDPSFAQASVDRATIKHTLTWNRNRDNPNCWLDWAERNDARCCYPRTEWGHCRRQRLMINGLYHSSLPHHQTVNVTLSLQLKTSHISQTNADPCTVD